MKLAIQHCAAHPPKCGDSSRVRGTPETSRVSCWFNNLTTRHLGNKMYGGSKLKSPRKPQARPYAFPERNDLPDFRKDIPSEFRSTMPAWTTLAAYAATQIPSFKFSPTPGALFVALAWYQVAWTLVSLLSGRYEFDRVGVVVGPAFLAVRALPALASRISAWDTAASLFGYFLARDLPGPLWAWLATLGYAVYRGWASHWAVGAFGLGSLWKLADHLRQGREGLPPLQHLAFATLAGWGLNTRQTPLLALLIFGGQLVASVVSDI